jgi:hypothetical protein
MKRILLPVVAALLLSLPSGCATKVYTAAKTGSSADLQEVLARSIEEAFASVPEEVWAHRISLEVIPSGGEVMGVSAYIRQFLTETISRHGGSLQPPHELFIQVIVPASGSLITERRLSLTMNLGGVANIRIPLFYGETFKGVTQTVIYYRNEKGELRQLARGEKKNAFHEIYWFWMIGPYESEALPQF